MTDQPTDTAGAWTPCSRCGVYLSAHRGRCPVTVECPWCAVPAGSRCRKPNGRDMTVGSHAARVREAAR